MRDEKHKHPQQLYEQPPFRTMKNMAKKGKTPTKKWGFRG